MMAMGDRQRSEGAIFETPRDKKSKQKVATAIGSSLKHLAGALNLAHAVGLDKKIAGGKSVMSPTGC